MCPIAQANGHHCPGLVDDRKTQFESQWSRMNDMRYATLIRDGDLAVEHEWPDRSRGGVQFAMG